jgi:hypothetical protein
MSQLEGLRNYGKSSLPRRQPVRLFSGTQNPYTSIGCGIFEVAIYSWYVMLHSMRTSSPRPTLSPRSFHISPCRRFLQIDKNDQCKSLDVRHSIQPSLEPENNNTTIDRQLNAPPVREVELQYPETSGIQIEPELDSGERMDITAEPDHTEISEPEHVHVPEPHQVDEKTANMAPTSGFHRGPVSEMPL